MKRTARTPRRKTATARQWDVLVAVFRLQRAGQRATATSVCHALDLRWVAHVKRILNALIDCGVLTPIPFTHWNGVQAMHYKVNLDALDDDTTAELYRRAGVN